MDFACSQSLITLLGAANSFNPIYPETNNSKLKSAKPKFRLCRFTLWLLKLWPHKQQPMKERESKVCCVLLRKLASGWSCLKQIRWPAVGRQGAKNSIAQLGFWKGTRWSDVHKPQMSLAFPGTVQSVPTLAVGFRKTSLVCPDRKPMALCHSCMSRGFQGTGSMSLGPVTNCFPG